MGVSVEVQESLAAKFEVLFPHLDERQRRLLAGAEARALGHGGIRVVARAAGVREAHGVARGRRAGGRGGAAGPGAPPGGGRKRLADLDPGLRPALLALVEPDERGDPMSPLRWTTKSLRALAAELTRQGHRVCADTVADLLREEGFSLQGNAKTLEGSQHPDRDAQFRYLNEQVRDHQRRRGAGDQRGHQEEGTGRGSTSNGGREWRPQGEPAAVNTHDFPDPELGKAIPYGIYDLAANTGWVNVGTDHDTAAFAVESIRRWWNGAGPGRLPGRPPAADHRRRRRLQRLPHPRLENRARRAGRRDRPGDHRLPLPARHLQMEQDRAPAVLPHHHELARPAADQPRGHRQHASPRPPPAPGYGSTPNSTPAPTPPASRSATSRWPPLPLTATTGTATGTTPCTPQPAQPRRHRPAPRPRAARTAAGWTHPALTGLTAPQWDQLAAQVAVARHAQREADLHNAPRRHPASRGRDRPPSHPHPRRPDHLTLLALRFTLPGPVLATLFEVHNHHHQSQQPDPAPAHQHRAPHRARRPPAHHPDRPHPVRGPCRHPHAQETKSACR